MTVESARTVVLAVPDFSPALGGTTTQVALQARELTNRGIDVVVLTRRRRREWPRHDRIDGVPVRRVGAPGHGRFAEKLAILPSAAWLVRNRAAIDTLETVQWTDAVFAAAAAGLLRQTIVGWAARGDATDAVAGPLGAIRKRLYGRTRQLALTQSMAEELEALQLPKPAVVPLLLDRSHFRPPSDGERHDARSSFGLDDELTVLYVGHLRALKGVDRLVAAFADLARDVAVRLLLVGGSRGAQDDVEPELREQVRLLGIDDAVTFAGVMRDTRPAYWASDVFVLPSTREGLPNTLLEAMACGLACIAPSSAAGDEALAGGAGLVPASNDATDLAVHLREVADPARRKELQRAALERSARYDHERVGDALAALIRGSRPAGTPQ